MHLRGKRGSSFATRREGSTLRLENTDVQGLEWLPVKFCTVATAESELFTKKERVISGLQSV